MAQRQRGFLTFYSLLISGLAVACFFGYERLWPFIPEVKLLNSLDLFPYGIAIFWGMLASATQLDGFIHSGDFSARKAADTAFRQAACVAVFCFALIFASKDVGMSRLFLGSYIVLLMVLLWGFHMFLPRLLARLFFSNSKKVPLLLIGKPESLAGLSSWIEHERFLGMPVVGYLDKAPPDDKAPPGIPWLGTTGDLERILREKGIRQVVLAEWIYDTAVVDWIIRVCEAEGCRFLLRNNYGADFAREFIPVREGENNFLTPRREPLENPLNRMLKRALDLFVSVPVVVFVLPPLCLWVWIMQKIQSPGRLFFIRPRGGLDWREFKMLKFRSMRMISENDGNIARQASVGDDRVYKFGLFLRKTSLDEFPQFINVLKGEMSVVGPRPHLVQHDREFCRLAPDYRMRSLLKPGLTGLAQIKGYRGEITDPEALRKRVHWDLYYLGNWSIFMDVKIILKTARHVLFPPKTAY